MNIHDLLNDTQTRSRVSAQTMTRGVIAGTDGPRYQVIVSGTLYVADAAITGLRIGDRVWVMMGWGAPRILGFFGPDQNEAGA